MVPTGPETSAEKVLPIAADVCSTLPVTPPMLLFKRDCVVPQARWVLVMPVASAAVLATLTVAEFAIAAEVAVTSLKLFTEPFTALRFRVEETWALLVWVLEIVATRPTSIDAVLPIAAAVASTLPPAMFAVRVMPALVSAMARATLFWLVLITVRCAMADETTEALSAIAVAVMKSDFLFTGYFPLECRWNFLFHAGWLHTGAVKWL